MFGASPPIAALSDDAWQQELMDVNLDANLRLLRMAHPLLKLAPRGGRVVVVAQKMSRRLALARPPTPHPKAALTQLARVAAVRGARMAFASMLIQMRCLTLASGPMRFYRRALLVLD